MFQVLNRHIWLVALTLNGAQIERRTFHSSLKVILDSSYWKVLRRGVTQSDLHFKNYKRRTKLSIERHGKMFLQDFASPQSPHRLNGNWI